MTPQEIEDAVHIDEHALDVEWQRQAELYYRLASEAADMRLEVDVAKSAIAVAKAEVDSEARNYPQKYKLQKVTDKAIDAAVAAAPQVVEAEVAYREARHKSALLDAAVQAMDHKKKALEKLVDLLISGVYGEPKSRSKESREYRQETEKRTARTKRPAGRCYTVNDKEGGGLAGPFEKLSDALAFEPDEGTKAFITKYKNESDAGERVYEFRKGSWERKAPDSEW